MGNTNQCSFLSNSDQQYQLLGEENHFLYGDIKHFKNQKVDVEHFAIKRLRFQSQGKLQQYRDFIQLYQQVCEVLHLTRAAQFNTQKKKQTSQGQKQLNNQKEAQPIFQCNKDNLIFTSATEQLSCSQASYNLTLNLQYLQQQYSLQSILLQKSSNLQKALHNNKVNQNILLQLESKVKLCEYQKIDKLPPKQRTIVNMFFNEIQVLRILDYMLTALYGLRINGVQVDEVRPELFFRSQNTQEVSYFCHKVVGVSEMGNYRKSFQALKRWLDEQNALFHHNWNLKERQLVSYVHPDHLEKLAEHLINSSDQNFVDFANSFSTKDQQRENIFALGLMILEICLLESNICSKIYHVSTCKSQQKPGQLSRKEMKYSFQKQNLTLRLNHSILQKYLIQMKTRYSDEFVQLVEFMMFGQNYSQARIGKDTVAQQIKYQQVIEKLSHLTTQNIQNLKQVYNYPPSHKSKSKPKHCTQNQSRKSSLSRQVSVSGVSSPSLSSSSSISLFPVQSQQRVLSLQLLRRNCKGIQSKVEKVLVRSQLETLHESFVRREEKLEELMAKDEERILCELNRLNDGRGVGQKQQRFSYRKAEQSHINKIVNNDQPLSPNTPNLQTNQFNAYTGYRINFPLTLSSKNHSQSTQKEKRMNSTQKTKKIILQKVRQEQNMGSSICQTIYLNKSKNFGQQDSSTLTMNNETALRRIDENISGSESFSGVEPFCDGLSNSFGGKSQLKNLMSIKSKTKQSAIVEEQSKSQLSGSQIAHKELKSTQLYQIYMKEYKNLIQTQKLVSS